MDLKILHNKHSNYFFLLTILLCLLQFFIKIDLDQVWVWLTCFFLIITIGASHGGLDNLKGKKLFNKLKLKNSFLIFYLAYISIAILILALWFNFGQIFLWTFLILASYHFGKEDTPDILLPKNRNQLLVFFKFFARGSTIIVMALFFHFEETIGILQFISTDSHFMGFYTINIAGLEWQDDIRLTLYVLILINIWGHIYLKSKKYWGSLFQDFLSIVLLNLVFEPFVAFTIYFCFLHSIRHSLLWSSKLLGKTKNSLKEFLIKSFPLTLITALLFVISVNLLYLIGGFLYVNIILVTFVGLASLTFPHILLEYLIEKNEK
ncbi:Brp/Blh family beta-carotene 15,15'-dioxygenase [Pelagibacterales bacterium SAG-MED01]|nr:Brp/Blh family beta-carotene 15,15'-dioxygenase [Pelagibacterales bacterium SAG-MED01]